MQKLLTLLCICNVMILYAQQTFETNSDYLQVKVNNVLQADNWIIDKNSKNNIFEAEVKIGKNMITYSDGIDSIRFDLELGQQKDFLIIKNNKDTIYQSLLGVVSNVDFTDEYIEKYKNKTIVAIPEVSELVNIIMALHPDAENEGNMFDTTTKYYKEVKKHFTPYLDHTVMDTIQKYITGLHYIKEHDVYLFSSNSYNYYYALKMNACGHYFNEEGSIVNEGNIKEMGKGYHSFNPMKDIKLIEDFARVTNFRTFYKDNKPYYDQLLQTYNQLNPIQKMQTWLDKKFQFSYGSYLVYFSPLINGAHSTRGYQSNGFNQTIMFIASAEYDDKLSEIQNELAESRVVFTEIDHNYVNPISAKYLEKINQVFSNRNLWTQPIITNSYESPYKIFNEYMTFAVYSLYINDNYSKQDLEEYLPLLNETMTVRRGFTKFSEFNKALLTQYQKNTDISIFTLYEFILDWCAEQDK